MEQNTIVAMLLGFILVAYLVLYFRSGRYISEEFQAVAPATNKRPNEKEVDIPEVEMPYTSQPINSDEDELNAVYMNESDTPMDDDTRSMLMSQYPKDWSTQPPSSSQFQSGVAGFKKSFENATQNVPDEPKSYDAVNGNLMAPPDLSEAEKEERKILQTYKPKFPPGPTSYDPRDVNDLIKQIYDKKGLIPQVHHKEGTNVYEITGVRKMGEHVKFEDEPAEATDSPNAPAMESTATTPPAIADNFQNRFSSASQWTPSLEKMFTQ